MAGQGKIRVLAQPGRANDRYGTCSREQKENDGMKGCGLTIKPLPRNRGASTCRWLERGRWKGVRVQQDKRITLSRP